MNIIPTGLPGFAEQGGLPLSLYPGDASYTVELQRAPDSAGAPNVGAAVSLPASIPGTQPVYVDPLPVDGTLYWYRSRHTGYGDTASSWTGWVGPFKALVIPDGLQRAPAIAPVIASARTQTQTTGTVTLTITDPQSRVTLVEFQTTDGAGGTPSGWLTDSSIPYSAAATLNGDVGLVESRVTGYDATGVLRVLAQGAEAFLFSPGGVAISSVLPTRVDSTHFTVDCTRAGFPSATTFDIAWSVDGVTPGGNSDGHAAGDFPVTITLSSGSMGATPTGKVTVVARYEGRAIDQSSFNRAFAI